MFLNDIEIKKAQTGMLDRERPNSQLYVTLLYIFLHDLINEHTENKHIRNAGTFIR